MEFQVVEYLPENFVINTVLIFVTLFSLLPPKIDKSVFALCALSPVLSMRHDLPD